MALAGAVYGNPTSPCLSSPFCPPTIVVSVNGTDYSSSFTPISVDGGATYMASGSVSNSTFNFSLNVTTHTDPDVDFETSIDGDPTVAITILQNYYGSFPSLTTTSAGTIFQLNPGGNPVSVTGSMTTFVHPLGGPQDTTDLGCSAEFTPATGTACTPTNHSSPLAFQDAFPNTLEMDINFTLSEGDKYTLTGGAALSSGTSAAPEPAAVLPLAGLFLAMAGFGWFHNRKRGSLS
jgi:hypothetical protein